MTTQVAPARPRTGAVPPSDSSQRVRVAVTCVAALLATYLLAVHTMWGQVLDHVLMLRTADLLGGAAWSEAVLHLVSAGSVGLGTLAVGVVALGSYGVAAAIRVTLGVVGTVVLSQLLKAVLVRPTWVDDAANSLPSGHVAATAAVVLAAVVAVPPALRWMAVCLAVLITGLTALATIAEQWHRPSDVVASVLLALAVLAVATPQEAPHRGGR